MVEQSFAYYHDNCAELQTMDSWFYDKRICVYTIINHIWITFHKIPCQISKVATKTTKKNCRCGEPFLYFSPCCDIPGDNLWRIFKVPTRSLWEPLKIFKILLKIFKDLSFSCQDLQGSSKFLPILPNYTSLHHVSFPCKQFAFNHVF